MANIDSNYKEHEPPGLRRRRRWLKRLTKARQGQILVLWRLKKSYYLRVLYQNSLLQYLGTYVFRIRRLPHLGGGRKPGGGRLGLRRRRLRWSRRHELQLFRAQRLSNLQQQNTIAVLKDVAGSSNEKNCFFYYCGKLQNTIKKIWNGFRLNIKWKNFLNLGLFFWWKQNWTKKAKISKNTFYKHNITYLCAELYLLLFPVTKLFY